MTRAQSMDVINDSTTLQSRIDTVLGSPIMEWDHSDEINWQPGDPLYPHPHEREDYYYPSEDRYEMFRGGNFVRRMYDVIYDHASDTMASQMSCQKCLVSGALNELECWNCGGRYERPRLPMFATRPGFDRVAIASPNSMRRVSSLMRAASSSAERAVGNTHTMSEAFSGLHVHFSMDVTAYAQAMRRLDALLFGDMVHTYRRGMLTRGYRSGRVVLDEWVTSDSGRVTIQVHPDHIRRVPPLLRVFDFDLGLHKPMVTNFNYKPPLGPWPAAVITIPRGIPKKQRKSLSSDYILDMQALRPDPNLARLSESRSFPTSLSATQSRRRRHI